MGLMKFPQGASVEVFDEQRNRWIPGVIFMRWNCATVPEGKRFYDYEVDGEDANGPWHGRFTEDHVREPGVNRFSTLVLNRARKKQRGGNCPDART